MAGEFDPVGALLDQLSRKPSVLPPKSQTLDNPVGTERVGGDTQATKPTPGVEPVVTTAFGIPMTQSQLDHISSVLSNYAMAAPITAYHSGPHLFDRFDSGKIGTGEGNQSYGHGLYFSQREDVAQTYKDAAERENPSAKAHMYEVQIGVEPENLLDWHGSFEQQPKALQELLKGMGAEGMTGGQIMRELSGNMSGIPGPEVSEALRAAGIPGVKYYDAGSRESADKTRNYVLFPGSDDLISILRRYAFPGIATGAAADAAAQPAQEKR